jgi:hypothetical protein
VPAPSDPPPYGAYAALVVAYAAGLTAAGGLARRLGRSPATSTPLDLALLSAATFKASRTIARDRVTSFAREPFVEEHAYAGEGEHPAGTGLRRAVGELVTCTRCIGTWTAAGLVATQLVAPRVGRLLTWSLAAAAANDFLQAGFTALTSEANRLEAEAG